MARPKIKAIESIYSPPPPTSSRLTRVVVVVETLAARAAASSPARRLQPSSCLAPPPADRRAPPAPLRPMDPQQPEPVSYLCGGHSFYPSPLASPVRVWPICRSGFFFLFFWPGEKICVGELETRASEGERKFLVP
ncbi:unknown protein [Oryza sativa Japonica Group]|uniref:Uncharacterized protein P0702H08.15 n=1 Tax=Oryza sativa subsp. japonica TaxID=39947 RepID=Q5JM27_ORYSJ|nr:unknown protein [Oryza sativa Japonica Group]